MEKLALVTAPLVLYAVVLGVRAALGKMPNRHALNVELSVALVLYFFATAGLGIFWVANQQLPPFDLHYLSGYATAALVVAHLIFNTRIVVRYFQKPKTAGRPRERRADPMRVVRWAGYLIGLVVAFFIGMRSGSTEISSQLGAGVSPSMKAIVDYHDFSSHSRRGVVTRAPGVSWEKTVPRYVDRSTLPQVELPKPILDRDSSGPMTIDDLSTLLWATAGITDRRGGIELRASASSGALFPSEFYVLARDVQGLEPGVYAYGPEKHVLAKIGGAPPSFASFGAADAGEPPLGIVATSVFRRSGQKYRDRAYRYAVADAGHALGNTLAAAEVLGLGAKLLARFDERAVAPVIGVDDVEEGVTAMVSIGRAVERGIAPAPLVFVGDADSKALELGATSLAHLATSMRSAPRLEKPEGATIALPKPAEPAPPVLPILEKRRSERTFAARPVTLAELGAWLTRSAAVEPMLSRALRVHVVAARVADLDPGVYRYHPADHSLTLTRPGAFGEAAGRAALDQEVVGGAPVSVWISFDRAVLEAEGPRAYRHAFLDAGLVGARLYIAAGGLGLAGSSVGAFYDEEAAELLGVPLEKEWPAHVFGAGVKE